MDNYFDMVKAATPGRVALIEDGTSYTYGEIVLMAEEMSEKVIKEIKEKGIVKGKEIARGKKAVYIIQEDSILKQLILFLACNMAGIIPLIVPSGLKALPEIKDVPGNVCMAAMTSGTTGAPKVLYRTYNSWAGFFPIQNKIFGVSRESILFAQGSLAFTGNMNLYMAQFYVGGTIAAENKFNPKRWAEVIKKENVNVIYLVPSKLMLLPDIIKEKNYNVKTIISGSQSLGAREAYIIHKIFPLADIILYYGASELGYITYVKDKDMTEDKNLIGKPFPETDVSVCGGRIYASSPFCAEGIKCPYELPDNGYMDKEGRFYFNGRSDSTVNIHGRKISLARIESELEKFGSIREAVAVHTVENGKDIIIAFASTVKGNSITAREISHNLRENLAHYEMPSKIILLDKMVYNESGKKDRNKMLENYKMQKNKNTKNH